MNEQATDRAERIERFRGYLLLLARLHTSTRLQGKLDASDVVQQTLVQALSGLEGFRGTSDAEMAVWLRQILARHLANVARDQGRQKRDVRRERSLEAALDQSASRLEAFLAADQSSPSQQAQRNEQVLRLADALATLPEPQREALTLHHLEHFSLEEVGRRLDRSPAAVAGLIKRALRALRLRLEEDE
jgi:RNA polymerase sigma-70 factor (ECF subfamily)